MITRNILNSVIFTASLALSACGPTPATTEGVNVGDRVAPEDRPPYRVYDNWDRQSRFSSRYNVYQNVDLGDVPPLLTGNTFVGYFTGASRDTYGTLTVMHWDSSVQYMCIGSGDDAGQHNLNWRSGTFESVRRRLEYPLLVVSKSGDWATDHGYFNIQYRGETGQLSFLADFYDKWWDMDKGHIQRGIPAAVYEICPDFPSAQSLGVPLIQDQTATNYFELLEQNPGNRIIRPDLVTDYTARHWYPE